jgi:antitoxin (DNA-binding transcriptional repressor) of toxin-antitoxin stability system
MPRIMAKNEVDLGDFRKRVTELIRQVEDTRQHITITRDGVAVAELCPVTVDSEALLGSVTVIDPGITRPAVDSGDSGEPVM